MTANAQPWRARLTRMLLWVSVAAWGIGRDREHGAPVGGTRPDQNRRGFASVRALHLGDQRSVSGFSG